MKRLKAHWKLLAVLLVLLAGTLWYSRPVDIYTLDPKMGTPDSIYLRMGELSGTRSPSDRTFYPEDPEWNTVLEQLEALRFRRPPWDLVLQFLDSHRATGRMVHPGDWHILLHATSRTGNVEILFFIDEWMWSSPHSNRNLTLWVENGRETGTALAEGLWALLPEETGNEPQ